MSNLFYLRKKINLIPAFYCLLYVAFAIVFAIIGLCLFNDVHQNYLLKRGELYWFHFGWFQFIFAFVWFEGFLMPFEQIIKDRRQIGATYIAFGVVAFWMALLSVSLLIISFIIPHGYGLLHIILVCMQMITLLIYLFIVAMLLTSKDMQLNGLECIDKELPEVETIIAELEVFEKKLSLLLTERQQLKKLREQLKYSIPARGKIAQSTTYPKVIRSIELLLGKINQGIETKEEDYFKITQELIRLKAECKY